MPPELITIGERALQGLESWQLAIDAIRGAGTSDDLPSAHTPGLTLADINVRTFAALSAIASLKDAEPAKLLLLVQRLPAVKTAIDAIENQSRAVIAAMEPWRGGIASDRNGHLQLQLQHGEMGTQVYDLGTPLAVVAQQTSILLDSLPYVAQAAGEHSVQVFAGIAQAASEQLAQAKDAAAQVRKELASSQSHSAKLRALSEQAEQVIKQIHDELTKSTAQKTAVEANVAEIVQKLAQAREVSKDADTLQQRTLGFAAQFEAFDSQMKARLELFAAFELSTGEALVINTARETTIKELTEKADTMIRGATTAGLSKSLEDTRALYEQRLVDTQKYFLWSVAALLVCSLPIAAQFVPGPWQQYFAPQMAGPSSEAAPWLSAVGKLILLIPGTWATAFFASNYAELFHLAREYAHKAALAKAIDGFKREAPDYAQEIVGSVFLEIQDNPGSRKAPAPATPQNPVTERFLSRVLEAIKVARGAKQ